MTYNEIMQTAGKEIDPSIYYTVGGTTTTKGHDDILSAKIYFNTPVLGTIMSGLSVEGYFTLPLETPIYFKNIATYDEYTQNKVYGPYYVKESEYNADTRTYSIELYDEFLTTMVEYKPITIAYPTTIYDFFTQLVSELNFTTSIASLPNGSQSVESDIYENIGYTYRDVLNDIAQATASRFKISNGDIDLAPLGTTTISIDDDILKNQNIEFGEHFGPINTIVLSRSADSDRIYYPDPVPVNSKEFKISDNQLMNTNNRDLFLSAIYNELNGLEYDIYDTELVGFGGFEPLDKIEISTDENGTTKTFNSYVFNNKQTFTQGYEETIYTELPDESVSDYSVMSPTDKLINQTNLIVNKQENKIIATVSEQDDLEQRMASAEATITSQGLTLEVKTAKIDDEGNSQSFFSNGFVYELTTDATFQSGKTYYIKSGSDFVIASVETGDPIPSNTYYEKNFKDYLTYEMNAEGFITKDNNTGYKVKRTATGDYYYDNDTMTGSYTKDGSVQKDMALFGRYYYGIQETLDVENFTRDNAKFMAQMYTAEWVDENGDSQSEEGFGHFFNN